MAKEAVAHLFSLINLIIRSNISNMNRKLFLACLLFAFFCTGLYAQIRLKGYRAEWINPELFVKRWPASWISCPGDDGRSYGRIRW